MGQTSEAFHFDDFKLRDGELYYKDKSMLLMIRGGKLRSVHVIAEILGKKGLHELGFDIPRGKLMARQAVMLERVEEELPSMSNVAKVDDIELQGIMENTVKSTEVLIVQFEGQEMLPMCELLGLGKQLRRIRGSINVEMAKKVQLKERIEMEKLNLGQRKMEIWDNPEYDDGIQEDIRKQIPELNDDLKVRQESIDLLKGRLTNQITGIKEMIAKVLDKETSSAEKIRTLFREQGIAIASILTAIRMAIGVLVKALLVVGLPQEVSLHLGMKKAQKNGSGTNSKPWHCCY